MTEIPAMVKRAQSGVTETPAGLVIARALQEIVKPYDPDEPIDIEHLEEAFCVEAALRDAGMVIVPREPTEAMLKAADDLIVQTSVCDVYPEHAIAWRAMVAAAQRGCAPETLEDSHWGRFMQTGGSAPPDKSK